MAIEELFFTVEGEDNLNQEIVKKFMNERKIIINQEVSDDLLEIGLPQSHWL